LAVPRRARTVFGTCGDVYHGFTKYGRVEDVKICTTSNSAWVYYKNKDDARDAIRGMDRREFQRGTITVQLSQTKPADTNRFLKLKER